MNISEKLCPICNNENESAATVCKHCGALLEENPTKLVSIPENLSAQPNISAENVKDIIDVELIPEEGVGICVVGDFKPYYVHIYKELVIGRGADATLESVLDLTDLNAVNMGVSRRHAVIRRTETGYAVIDLSSRNGTWLNSERLIPNKPYAFASGSKIRIGQMALIIIYRTSKDE